MDVFVYEENGGLALVGQGVDPEEWARTWGVRNYPEAIYFVAEIVMPA